MSEPFLLEHASSAAKYIQGIPMITTVISSAVSAAVGAGLAWYIRGRGMTGVKIDMDNAKHEIEKLKSQVSALTSTPAVA